MPLPLTFVGTSSSGVAIVAQPIVDESNVNITTEDGTTPITTEGT